MESDLSKTSEKVLQSISFVDKSLESILIRFIIKCIRLCDHNNINRTLNIEYHDQGIYKITTHTNNLKENEIKNYFLQNDPEFPIDVDGIDRIIFHSIVDAKYSTYYHNCHNTNQTIETPNQQIKNQDIDTQTRESLNIPEDGIQITIILSPGFKIHNPSDQAESLSRLAALRDVMNNMDNVVTYTHFDSQGNKLFARRLIFEYPGAEMLLDLNYNVPNYTDIVARFRVYKTPAIIAQPKKDNELIFGFVVKDDQSIYEVSTIAERFRWHPYINLLFGFIKCNHIHNLSVDYHHNGPSKNNPIPILSKSKLNKKHPFIESLLSIPKIRLDYLLRKLDSFLSYQSFVFKKNNRIINDLSEYGLNVIRKNRVKLSKTQTYDQSLAQKIHSNRLSYINTEMSYLVADFMDVDEIKNKIKNSFFKPRSVNCLYVIYDNGDNFIKVLDHHVSRDHHNIKTIKKIINEYHEILSKNPYIYKLLPDGSVIKLYVFDKNKINAIVDPECKLFDKNNKKLNIFFTENINFTQRYIVEHEDSINIRLNVNNNSVKKYITLKSKEHNISMPARLIFFQELMTDVLSDIILESDIIEKKLVLHSNDVINNRNINSYKNKLVSKLEGHIQLIFSKYANEILAKKKSKLTRLIKNSCNSIKSIDSKNPQYSDILSSEINNLVSCLFKNLFE